jgi:GrpB-like predicted nucleotidyltransferase (UPF0157 family)
LNHLDPRREAAGSAKADPAARCVRHTIYASAVDDALAAKLREIGLAPDDFGDPAEAWHKLHERFATRATLLDRYALEAHARGIALDGLSEDERTRMQYDVIAAHTPGFEVVAGSDRTVRDPIEVADYDSEWPARFATWRDRLASSLGATALRIEHVGSTSVPGLPAKAVVDIQLSVPDIANESSYVPPIEAIGVALRSRDDEHRYFRPAGGRPRDVQIHVCNIGSNWERVHLLFRDYLRSHNDAAAEYAAMKRRVAALYRDDRIAYNEAKTDFILDELQHAEEWAAATGWRAAS